MKAFIVMLLLLLTWTGCTKALLFDDNPEPTPVGGTCCSPDAIYYGWASVHETVRCGTAIESYISIQRITDRYAQPIRITDQYELMARLSTDFYLNTADINSVVLNVVAQNLPDSITRNPRGPIYIAFKKSIQKNYSCITTYEQIRVVSIYD